MQTRTQTFLSFLVHSLMPLRSNSENNFSTLSGHSGDDITPVAAWACSLIMGISSNSQVGLTSVDSITLMSVSPSMTLASLLKRSIFDIDFKMGFLSKSILCTGALASLSSLKLGASMGGTKFAAKTPATIVLAVTITALQEKFLTVTPSY